MPRLMPSSGVRDGAPRATESSVPSPPRTNTRSRLARDPGPRHAVRPSEPGLAVSASRTTRRPRRRSASLERARPARAPARTRSWPRSRRAETSRRRRAGPLHSAQFTRNPSRNSALPRAPRMGDATAPIGPRGRGSRPSASISSTTRRRVSSRPHDAAARDLGASRLELRLDEDDDGAAGPTTRDDRRAAPGAAR